MYVFELFSFSAEIRISLVSTNITLFVFYRDDSEHVTDNQKSIIIIIAMSNLNTYFDMHLTRKSCDYCYFISNQLHRHS